MRLLPRGDVGPVEATEKTEEPLDQFGEMAGDFYFGCLQCGCPVCQSPSGVVKCCDCCCDHGD
jgi:hypothetical protein